ncbi:30S ribosomal protein S12 methylthiotransferase RimO [Oscillospiraceae bacterium CM]|nr:30S ribosomal protein S12 methylthiotransferase RimO [Oscillospiraceae bacterium CM]
MKTKIGLISLGCPKNRVVSEQMLYLLREAGFDITGETDGVDAVVVNTCGFIDSAKKEAIETVLALGEAKKKGRIKKIIVTGCLAERYKVEILAELPEIDAVLGVGSASDIVAAVTTALSGRVFARFDDKNRPDPDIPRVVTTSDAWAYLKVAEGCDNRCAFCVIPDIRGRFRSRPMESVIKEAEALVQGGVKELIVVAQDTTRYGLDLYGKRSLAELLKKLCAIDGLNWIRLHYLYPDEMDDDLIAVIAEEEKILKYLDIPMQHISDRILKKMGRRGTGDEIRALFEKLRARIPGVVLRTSLIVGLPGEGEQEFLELMDFLREARIERAGVFTYSPEEGTPAAVMDRPDAETAAKRAEAVMALQSDVMDAFNNSRLGTTVTILAEGVEDGLFIGRSWAESPEIDGYIHFTGRTVKPGDIVTVHITGTRDGEPSGEQINRGDA